MRGCSGGGWGSTIAPLTASKTIAKMSERTPRWPDTPSRRYNYFISVSTVYVEMPNDLAICGARYPTPIAKKTSRNRGVRGSTLTDGSMGRRSSVSLMDRRAVIWTHQFGGNRGFENCVH